MQGVIKAYDPGTRTGLVLTDTDLSEYDLAADAIDGSVFRMLRPGQRVTIHADTYGAQKFEGTVDSIAGATGSRQALLPPQNATGNFVKVVQRIPVKIALDDSTLATKLRPGLSVLSTVRTKQ